MQRSSDTVGLEVVREVRVDASPETIFPFLTDAAELVRWMGAEAELDPVAGGVYRVRIAEPIVARGEFVAVEPHTRVAFTFGWEGEGQGVPPGSSLVEITLEPDGDATIVRLRHSELPDENACEQHGQGWQHYLSRLAVAGAGGDPGPDPMGR